MGFQSISFLPLNWINAFHSTLFHSIWISVVMAFLTGIIVVSTKKSTANLRYNLLTTLLGVFVLTMAFVFYSSFNAKESVYFKTGKAIESSLSLQQKLVDQIAELRFLNFIKESVNIWDNYASQIVFIWFLLLFVKAIQLFAGVHSVYYLRNAKVFDAGQYWDNKLRELSNKMAINQTVRILQSGIAKVPLVAGHFKPIILIPLGLLNNLSLTEVEAILSHELAHIKRRDYLINIVQSFVEVFFFFNPAVLWISKLIREERENCCDDLAISCTNNKQEYIKALISCQELNLKIPAYGMAITGRENQLLDRVRRMMFNHNSSLDKIEKTALTASVVGLIIAGVAFTSVNKNHMVQEIAVIKAQQKENNKIVREEIPIKNILATVWKKIPITINKQNSFIKASSIKGNFLYKKEQLAYNQNLIKYESKNDLEDKSLMTNLIKPLSQQLQLTNELNTNQVTSIPKESIKNVGSVDLEPPRSTETTTTTITTSITTTSTVIDGKVMNNSVYHDFDDREAIRNDMIKDSLIRLDDHPYYVLNKDEMFINGIKQNVAIHEKYKIKYIKNPDTQYRVGA